VKYLLIFIFTCVCFLCWDVCSFHLPIFKQIIFLSYYWVLSVLCRFGIIAYVFWKFTFYQSVTFLLIPLTVSFMEMEFLIVMSSSLLFLSWSSLWYFI
jgi:hypothetical protein